MNSQSIQSKSRKAIVGAGAFATVAFLSGTFLVSSAVPAAAQAQGDAAVEHRHSDLGGTAASTSDASVQARNTSSSNGSMSTRIPGSVQPIITRIAEMWVAANRRANDTSFAAGSRESYRTAATSLRQALTYSHVRPTGRNDSRYNADLIISSGQMLSDIAQLRTAAASMTGPRAADLVQVATLYATGAKDYFTGSIRDALLSPNSSRNRLASNGSGATTSGDLGITSRRPNTTVPVLPLPDPQAPGVPSVSMSSYGFSPDSAFWGPPNIVGGGNGFGNTVVVGPSGIGNIPDTNNGNVPIVNPAPTVVIP